MTNFPKPIKYPKWSSKIEDFKPATSEEFRQSLEKIENLPDMSPPVHLVPGWKIEMLYQEGAINEHGEIIDEEKFTETLYCQ